MTNKTTIYRVEHMPNANHTLWHAITGCACQMADITNCVICEKRLAPDRQHTDTCGERCFRTLLNAQSN